MPASSPPFRWAKKNKKKGNNRLFISPKNKKEEDKGLFLPMDY